MALSNTTNFQTSILPINGTLKGTTSSDKSRSGSNGNERYYTQPRSSVLEPYHQMQFSVIPRTPIFCRGNTQHILGALVLPFTAYINILSHSFLFFIGKYLLKNVCLHSISIIFILKKNVFGSLSLDFLVKLQTFTVKVWFRISSFVGYLMPKSYL